MKGVILAGGTGSRLHPLTRITNKHLLPVYDKPMIFYPIETLVSAGIDEIMVVTGGNHAGEFLPLLGNGSEFGLRRLQFSYQAQAGGIAEALGLCESFVDGDKVVVMLGDNIVGQSIAPYVQHFVEQPQRRPAPAQGDGGPEPSAAPRRADLRQGRPADVHPRKARDAAQPVRRHRHLHVRPGRVFDIVRDLKPSGRGELEITDVNNAYVDRGLMEYDVIDGFWGDAGESIDVYYEVIDHVRQHGANKPPRPRRELEPSPAWRSEAVDAHPGHRRRRLHRLRVRPPDARRAIRRTTGHRPRQADLRRQPGQSRAPWPTTRATASSRATSPTARPSSARSTAARRWSTSPPRRTSTADPGARRVRQDRRARHLDAGRGGARRGHPALPAGQHRRGLRRGARAAPRSRSIGSIRPARTRPPKLAASCWCWRPHKTYGLPALVVRGANAYGPYQYPEKLIPLHITNAIDDQPLPVYGDGQQRRQWTHVVGLRLWRRHGAAPGRARRDLQHRQPRARRRRCRST